MPNTAPGFQAIKETEEVQLFATGPDNNHQRMEFKGTIKSSVTDSGNSPTTTLRGGRVLGLRDADSLLYHYDSDATNGDQKVVGVLPNHTSMLDKDGTAVNQTRQIAIGGIIKNVTDLLGYDLAALAVLLRRGFHINALEPHGSAFGCHFKARYFDAADYTVLATDHGCMRVATAACNYTLPSLAAVGKGFQVMLYNAADATMVITGAADTIQVGDAGGGLATSLTFSTANKKRGGQALMYSDYASDGGSLCWYALFLPTAVTVA